MQPHSSCCQPRCSQNRPNVGTLRSEEQEDLLGAGLGATAVEMLTSSSYHDSVSARPAQHEVVLSAKSSPEHSKPSLGVV